MPKPVALCYPSTKIIGSHVGRATWMSQEVSKWVIPPTYTWGPIPWGEITHEKFLTFDPSTSVTPGHPFAVVSTDEVYLLSPM